MVSLDPHAGLTALEVAVLPSEMYASYLNQLRQDYPMVEIHYTDEELQQHGMAQLNKQADQAQAVVEFIKPKRKGTSQRLHAALDAYSKYVEQKYDGNKRYRDKLVDRVEALKRSAKNVPLAEMDANSLDVWFEMWAARPAKPSGGLYAKHTIRDIVKALRNFLKWLHRDKEWDWRLPESWDMPRVRIKTLPEERAAKRQLPKFKRDELAILYNSAVPLERLFLLRGLNCGFGKAEVETLQISEIQFGEKTYIRRERTKTGVYGCWRLWPETVAGLRWYLNHARPKHECGYVFVSREGRPYYRTTEKGNNPNMRIPNTWARLIKRIKKDHKEFRSLSFNKLRKTSSSWMRKHFGGEVASIFLSNGRVTDDALLEEYATRHFGRVWRATDAFGRWIRKTWNVDEPFPTQTDGIRTVLPLGTIKKIEELAMQGFQPRTIAEITGVSESTCKRYAKKAKQKLAEKETVK